MGASVVDPITPKEVMPKPANIDMGYFDPSKKYSYFAILFYLLLSAMTIREGTVNVQAKQLSLNASIQNRLNKENGDIKFSILPSNAKTATINRVQEENQEYAAMRGDLEDRLITARQVAQVTMTQTSTNVDLLQQDASENAGWLKILNTVFQVIDEMTGGK